MAMRLGVFGGTFDPPHLGHLILASESLPKLNLDRVLWVPTGAPPHKPGYAISSVEHRVAMLRLTLEGEATFELSTVEVERAGPHYTLDTILLLETRNPGSELVLVIGGDSLHDLPDWHRPAELLAACAEIGVMRRPGDGVDLAELEDRLPGLSAKVRFIDVPLLQIASHEIRKRVAEGHPFRHYVPARVYAYIVEHGLYLES